MKRRKLPTMIAKQVFQEAASCCSFCNEPDVTALEVHHLDENPNNNALDNLLLVCSSCHSKITHGSISTADAYTQKRIVQYQAATNRTALGSSARQSVIVENTANSGIIANVVNFQGKASGKMHYPPESIGSNVIMKGYIDYLYGQYIRFRKADVSFGAIAHAKRFHPGELHRTIRARFKAQTFFIHVARFEELIQYIHERINATILGRRNTSRGSKNYDSFEEYKREQLGG